MTEEENKSNESKEDKLFPRKIKYTKENDNLYLKGCGNLKLKRVDINGFLQGKTNDYKQLYKSRQFKIDQCSIMKLNKTRYDIPQEIIFVVPDNAVFVRKILKEGSIKTDDDISNSDYYNIQSEVNYPIYVFLKDKDNVCSKIQLKEANIYLNQIELDDKIKEGKTPQEINELNIELKKQYEKNNNELIESFYIDTKIIDNRLTTCSIELIDYTNKLNKEIININENELKKFKPKNIKSEKDLLLLINNQKASFLTEYLNNNPQLNFEYNNKDTNKIRLKEIKTIVFESEAWKKEEEIIKKSNISTFIPLPLKKCIAKDFTASIYDNKDDKDNENQLSKISQSIINAQKQDFMPIITNYEFDLNKDIPIDERVFIVNKNVGTIRAYKIIDENETDNVSIIHDLGLLPNEKKNENENVVNILKDLTCPETIKESFDVDFINCKPEIVYPIKRTPPSLFNKLYDGIPIETRILASLIESKRKNLKILQKNNNDIDVNDSILNKLKKKFEVFLPYEEYGYIIGYNNLPLKKNKSKIPSNTISKSFIPREKLSDKLFGQDQKEDLEIKSNEPIDTIAELETINDNEIKYYDDEIPIDKIQPTDKDLFEEKPLSFELLPTKLKKQQRLKENLENREKFD